MRLVQKKHTDLPFIQDIDPQGPAAKTNINVGDILLEVNGVDARASACARDLNWPISLPIPRPSGGQSGARLTRGLCCACDCRPRRAQAGSRHNGCGRTQAAARGSETKGVRARTEGGDGACEQAGGG